MTILYALWEVFRVTKRDTDGSIMETQPHSMEWRPIDQPVPADGDLVYRSPSSSYKGKTVRVKGVE